MQGNQNAKKAEKDKITGKGRMTFELGNLKAKLIKRAKGRGISPSALVRELIEGL